MCEAGEECHAHVFGVMFVCVSGRMLSCRSIPGSYLSSGCNEGTIS